jgi:hypothetical protein
MANPGAVPIANIDEPNAKNQHWRRRFAVLSRVSVICASYDANGTVDSIRRARERGIPIVGMLYWSLTDNYEWGSTVRGSVFTPSTGSGTQPLPACLPTLSEPIEM